MRIISPDPGTVLPGQVQPDVNHQELGSLPQLRWDPQKGRQAEEFDNLPGNVYMTMENHNIQRKKPPFLVGKLWKMTTSYDYNGKMTIVSMTMFNSKL